MINKLSYISIIFSLVFTSTQVYSQDQSLTFEQFTELCLKNAKDLAVAEKDRDLQIENFKSLQRSKYIPHADLSFLYQKNYYDRLKDDGTGRLISNNGDNPGQSLTLSYDTQNFFSPDTALAQKRLNNSETTISLTKDQLYSKIQAQYFNIKEIEYELKEYDHIFALLEKITGIIKRQALLGVNNDLEAKQFDLLKNSISSDYAARKLDLENSYLDFSSFTGLQVADLKKLVFRIQSATEPQIPESPDAFSTATPISLSTALLKNIQQDAILKKYELEHTTVFPAPSVYFKISRDSPTMFSADGPQTSAEIGVTIPLDSYFLKNQQKSQLAADYRKSQLISEQNQNFVENQAQAKVAQLKNLIAQHESLLKAENLSESLLDKSFSYYSQKKIDPLGAADIFTKYLQAKKNRFSNEAQILTLSAELQYLKSGGLK